MTEKSPFKVRVLGIFFLQPLFWRVIIGHGGRSGLLWPRSGEGPNVGQIIGRSFVLSPFYKLLCSLTVASRDPSAWLQGFVTPTAAPARAGGGTPKEEIGIGPI